MVGYPESIECMPRRRAPHTRAAWQCSSNLLIEVLFLLAMEPIKWGNGYNYGNGITPSVAMNDHGVIVEVHRGECLRGHSQKKLTTVSVIVTLRR